MWSSGLPVDLQYLPEDKKREDDPDIRKMLLETLLLVSAPNAKTQSHRRARLSRAERFARVSLLQLTATGGGRNALKDKSVYPIMREFHRWEKDVHVTAACEKLVQVGQISFMSLLQSDVPQINK